ncbi:MULTISPECIES: FecR domain-containing protein [Pseudomonas]|uniref:FecR family protein n=1 Tax=Pseudomonas TaxID=286 RepID=UPI001E54A71B|nr:FecR domain-containing protein [Pseudomonas sp.]MCE0937910.1 FecR domain-containing protein [Pseudomonas kurunegalensis]
MSPEVLHEAAEWFVRLDDQPSGRDREAFRAWLEQDSEHLEAFQRMQETLAPLQVLKHAPARSALRAFKQQRRSANAMKALALAVVLALPLVLFVQQGPAYLLADIRTGSGEWATRQLPDGSLLRLDGGSAVDLDFDDRTRTVRLLRGEILVDVAKDAGRPFKVVTEHGSVRALGTRFVVEQLAEGSRLAMIESTTEVDSHGQRRVVSAGQELHFDATGPGEVQPVDGRGVEQAWARHQLVVRERPLVEVLEQLSRNHSGYLLFDRKALANIRVTAVLPADDSERALRLLARSLPLGIDHYTTWITRVRYLPESELR